MQMQRKKTEKKESVSGVYEMEEKCLEGDAAFSLGF